MREQRFASRLERELNGACNLFELSQAGAELPCGLIVAVELIRPHRRHGFGQLVADTQQFQRAQSRIGVVEVLAEGVHVPLQGLLEPGRAKRCLARFLTGFVAEAFAPSRFDVVPVQRERPRTLAPVSLR